MSSISKVINELNNAYAEISVEKMQVLCRIAGVEYQNSEQAKLLQQEMNDNGYYLQVEKHSAKDDCVGQTLILRDANTTFIRGYRIWIDFQDDYKVKVKDLFSETDLPSVGELN